jgi:hypothetical protein
MALAATVAEANALTGEDILNSARDTVESIPGTDERRTGLRTSALSGLDQVREARDNRALAAAHGIPSFLWVLLGLGTVLLLISPVLSGVTVSGRSIVMMGLLGVVVPMAAPSAAARPHAPAPPPAHAGPIGGLGAGSAAPRIPLPAGSSLLSSAGTGSPGTGGAPIGITLGFGSAVLGSALAGTGGSAALGAGSATLGSGLALGDYAESLGPRHRQRAGPVHRQRGARLPASASRR